MGKRAIITRIKPAINLEKINLNSEIGFVSNNSKVPVLFSSEKSRIVIAGIKNIKIEGARMKKFVKLDSPISNRLELPGLIHKKNPVAIRKKTIAIYPVRELRKAFNSFLIR